jgi:hypothetical protein
VAAGQARITGWNASGDYHGGRGGSAAADATVKPYGSSVWPIAALALAGFPGRAERATGRLVRTGLTGSWVWAVVKVKASRLMWLCVQCPGRG